MAVIINNNTLKLFLKDPNSSASAIKSFDAGLNAQSVAIGDLGGNAQGSDVAVADAGPPEDQAAKLFLHDRGNSSGYTTMTLPAAMPSGDSGPVDVAIGDLSGSGKPDLVTANAFSADLSLFANTTP